MKASDKKLQASLMEAMKLDDAKLEEEMKNSEPHVFSESFENRMEELIQVQKRKRKRSSFMLRFAASAAVVVLLVGGGLYIGSEQLRASAISIDIREWLEEFFTVENGSSGLKDEEVLFEENQIGYIPEGFEKILKDETFSLVYYKYQKKAEENFIICIARDKAMLNVDNDGAETEVKVNAAGYEYTYTKRVNEHDEALMWKDQDNIYYYVTGTIGYVELVKIMDGISY